MNKNDLSNVITDSFKSNAIFQYENTCGKTTKIPAAETDLKALATLMSSLLDQVAQDDPDIYNKLSETPSIDITIKGEDLLKVFGGLTEV